MKTLRSSYSPAADGGGFPAPPTKWLSGPRDVSTITSVYIDGDIWLADGGELLRVVNGNSAGWEPDSPGDAILRGDPVYRILGSGAERRTGTIYGFDASNDRLLGLSKVNGAFLGQYRLGGETGWSDFRSFYVEPGVEDEPDAIVWIDKNGLHRSILVTTGPGASPAPSGQESPEPEDEG